jgi:pimeloyl-ACP methyl ester carboxylesterase
MNLRALARGGCRIRRLRGERDDSAFRPASLLTGEVAKVRCRLDPHRIPKVGHRSAYENAPHVNRLLPEFSGSGAEENPR